MFQAAELRDLAAFGDEVGVLSLYSSPEPGAPTAPVRLRNRLGDLRLEWSNGAGGDAGKMILERLDALEGDIEAFLDPAAPGRGRALFAQVAGDAVRTAWIQVPVGDDALFGPGAHLWPLVVAAEQAAPAGVVRVGRDGLRLVDLRYGAADELDPVAFNLAGTGWPRGGDATLPGYTRGGIHPDRFDQRVEEHLAKYLRQSAPMVDEAARRNGWRTAILAGDPRTTATLDDDLAADVPTVEVDAVLDPHLSPAEVLEWAEPVLAGVRARAAAEEAGRAADLALSGGNAALGLPRILAMLRDGRVDRLLLDPEGAWRTTTDGGLTGDALGDHMIHLAVARDATFTLLDAAAATRLGPQAAGIAAFLRW